MTAAVDLDAIPVWTREDRMEKALKQAGMTALAMADYLGVSRGTVATWLHGKHKPSTASLMLWALRCGVPYGWLLDGEDWVRRQGLEPRTRWLRACRPARASVHTGHSGPIAGVAA